MLDALIAHKGYNWQAFGQQDGVWGTVSAGTCASVMESYCNAAMYNSPVLMDMSDGSEQVVTAFLVVRGPYWWQGYGWFVHPCM